MEIDKNGRLLEQGENQSGNSPLQMAILANNELFSEEIAKKCSSDQINHRNFKGETSLHMAGRAGMAIRILNTCTTVYYSGVRITHQATIFGQNLPIFGLMSYTCPTLYDFYKKTQLPNCQVKQ